MTNSNWLEELRRVSGSRDESGLPVYRRMIDLVSQMISDGRMPDAMHLPPDKELSARIGISHITWAKVLNELQKRGMVERSRQRGTFISRPVRHAVSGGTGNIVTVFMDDINSRSLNLDFMDIIQCRLAAAGYRTSFVSASENRQLQYSQIAMAMQNPDCCGGLVWSLLDEEQINDILQIRPVDWPLIFMEGSHSTAAKPVCDLIRYDWFNAGSELAERFISGGGRYFICVMCGRHMGHSGLTLLRAIEKKLIEHGLPVENLNVIRQDDADIEISGLIDRHDNSLLIAFERPEITGLKATALRHQIAVQRFSPAVAFVKSGFPPQWAWELPLYRFNTGEVANQAVSRLLEHLGGGVTEYRNILIPGYFDGNGSHW